ncbi:PASTA domain-containing protein [bacterium]|nr:PASTA domain-containing protein [bacterium]
MKSFFISFFTALVVAVLVCLGFQYGVFEQIRLPVGRGNVQVPRVIGATLEQAKLIIEGKGLQFVIDSEREDPEILEGCIIVQKPLAESVVRKGSRVRVVVSKGMVGTIIPDVVNTRSAQARQEIEKAGLKIGNVSMARSNSVPKGYVISQDPVAGTKAEEGKIVNLIVSVGSRKVTVPNLYGKNLSQAQAILERRSLKVGQITHTCDVERLFGIILRQYPVGGRKADRDSAVNLVINAEAAE